MAWVAPTSLPARNHHKTGFHLPLALAASTSLPWGRVLEVTKALGVITSLLLLPDELSGSSEVLLNRDSGLIDARDTSIKALGSDGLEARMSCQYGVLQ
jgi:hypothetical protein